MLRQPLFVFLQLLDDGAKRLVLPLSPSLSTVGGTRFGSSNEHADTLAGETAAVNGKKSFYGTTFRIPGAADSYLVE